MIEITFNAGDPCWIFADRYDDNTGLPLLEEGRVVGVFNMPDYPVQFYIIHINNPEWMHLEVRDALLMSKDPNVLPAVMSKTSTPQDGLLP